MEPTELQSRRIKQLREIYGKSTVKPHAPTPPQGHMRVSLTCLAGTWEWYYNTDGQYLYGTLATRLFEPPQTPHRSHNAIDN